MLHMLGKKRKNYSLLYYAFDWMSATSIWMIRNQGGPTIFDRGNVVLYMEQAPGYLVGLVKQRGRCVATILINSVKHNLTDLNLETFVVCTSKSFSFGGTWSTVVQIGLLFALPSSFSLWLQYDLDNGVELIVCLCTCVCVLFLNWATNTFTCFDTCLYNSKNFVCRLL